MKNPLPCFLLLLPWLISAQNNRTEQQAAFSVQITRTQSPVTIDGNLEEAVWQSAQPAQNFQMKWPRDGGPAPAQTEVRCAFDDRNLYIAAFCIDSTPKNVINSLKRDIGYWDSDGFGVVIDPTNTANNGYFFGVNVAGVQTEALVATGVDDMDVNWDNVWHSAVKNGPYSWTVEFAIPLRILRFKEGNTTWGINFIRNDLGNGIYSIWARVPFQLDGLDLGWTGAMHWAESPKRVKGNVNLIPYINTGVSKDYEAAEDWKTNANAGLDAKIGIGSGLNLDVTLNPDFSQVEIDQQVINLTRFDVQLPEKRTFFLENADLFGNFGIPPLRPFFSRKIGLDDDGNPLPILAGLRLSGNLNADTRIGVMTMQTGKKDSLPSRNNTAIALKRRVFGRSTVSGYFLDREDFKGVELQKSGYSRNAGLEFLYISNDGKWQGWLTHHRSSKAGVQGQNWWGNAGFAYISRRFTWVCDYTQVEENYYANLGFEQRIENYDELLDTTFRIPYRYVFNQFEVQFFPKNKDSRLNFTQIAAPILLVLNQDGSINEFSPEITYTAFFKNTSELSLTLRPLYANLPVSFKVDDDEDLEKCPPLPPGQYQFTQVGGEWNHDYRSPFFYSVGFIAGEFYNGKQLSFRTEIAYRFQPFMNVRLEAEYNKLSFPEPYCDVEYFNITPRVEVFFAKNLWWTTFVQYNTQTDNFNVNSRLQWRYRPMSDLFLVYTDNYAVKIWGPRNKTLVLKANYWL